EFFFFQAEDGIRDATVTGVQTCALPISSAAEGIRGPIGLGFRVPQLVVSPFSRGGFVCSKVFDLTSTLRFLERRFGAKVPNLSRSEERRVGNEATARTAPVPSHRTRDSI